ncbi:MAG: hypothetical protein MI921_06705 [Cytophagales bacterium]|nr:hypothetical protein [Cytophagales bacterium]
MKRLFIINTIFCFACLNLFFGSTLWAQSVRFPVGVTFNVPQPHRQGLIEYVAVEERINASLQFNGNASQWDVRLRLTIEGISNNVRIQTNPNVFIEPIRLNQFELTSLSIADLTPYFDYSNNVFSGISAEDLENSGGGLPAGTYRFCLEALDNRTLTPLSNASCANVNVIVRQPPLLNQPACGNITSFSQQQNFSFSWSSVPGISQYRLTIAEVLEGRTPLDALEINNPNMQVFEVTGNFFQIPQDAFLRWNQGQTYVYRVQAVDPMEQTNLFNDGFSTICTFQYGYSAGGSLALSAPSNREVIPPVSSTIFAWGSPDNLSAQQPLSYHMRVVELDEGEQPEDAIANNAAVFQDSTRITHSGSGWSMRLRESLAPEKNYAWQVKAYTHGVEIAASNVQTFETSPLISEIHAGKHIISVTTLRDGATFSNLTGEGTLMLDADSNRYEVSFVNLEVKLYSGRMILEDGIIDYELPDEFEDIPLSPKETKNGEATFYPEKIQLDKYALQIYGQARWQMPFLLTEDSRQAVITAKTWVNYDALRLNGKIPLTAGNYFRFQDPYDFRLLLREDESDFLVSNNTFQQRFFGFFILPEAVDGNQVDSVSFSFRNFDQLFYNRMEAHANNGISLSANANFHLIPRITVIDLEDSRSPGTRSSDQLWKGAYFEEYDMVLKDKFDDHHLVFPNTITHSVVQGQSTDYAAEVSTNGLQLEMTQSYDASNRLAFNTFGGHLRKIAFSIMDNSIEKGLFEASIHVPFIRDELIGCEITLTDEGFENNRLQEDLSSYEISFGQKTTDDRFHAFATLIETPYFDSFNALKADLDFRWAHFDIVLNNVTDLKIWGNGKVGFGTPGGRYRLDEYVVGRLDQYEITIFDLGIELYKSIYAVSTGYQISFGEDITGKDGKPVAAELITGRGFDRPRYQTREDNPAFENEENEEDIEQPSLIGDRTAFSERQKILDNQTSHWGNFTEGSDSFSNHHKAGEGAMKNFTVEPYSSFYFKMNLLVIIAEFSGFRVKDDPEWGDCTTGFGSAMIRFPFEYNGSAKITLGKTTGDDPFNYWMFDVSYGMGEFANVTNPLDAMVYEKINTSKKNDLNGGIGYGIDDREEAANFLEDEKEAEIDDLLTDKERDVQMSGLREKEGELVKAQEELDLLRDKSTDRKYREAKEAYETASRDLEEKMREIEARHADLKKEIDDLEKEKDTKKRAAEKAGKFKRDQDKAIAKNPVYKRLQKEIKRFQQEGKENTEEFRNLVKENNTVVEGLRDSKIVKEYNETKDAYEDFEAKKGPILADKKETLKKAIKRSSAPYKQEIDNLKKDKKKKRQAFNAAIDRRNLRRQLKKNTTIKTLEEKVVKLKTKVKNERGRLSPGDLNDLKKIKSKEAELKKSQQKYNDFLETSKRFIAKERELEEEAKKAKDLVKNVEADIEVNERVLQRVKNDKHSADDLEAIMRIREKGYDLLVKKEELTKKMNTANGLLDEHRNKNKAIYDERERLRKETESTQAEIDKTTTRRAEEWRSKEPLKSAHLDKKKKELSHIKAFLDDRTAIRNRDDSKLGTIFKNIGKRMAGSQKNALADELKGRKEKFQKRPNSALFPNKIVSKSMTGIRKALVDGINMGPITMVGGMFRVFKHMNYGLDDDTQQLIDTFNGEEETTEDGAPMALTDLLQQSTIKNAMAGSSLGTSADNTVTFKPDRNVICGITFATSIIDTPTFGATFSGTATLDLAIGESGFFRLDANMDLFNMRTILQGVDYSMFQARATAFFAWDKKGLKTGALTADFTTGSNVLCGEGDLAFLYHREPDFDNVILEIGKPDKRIYLLPGCFGMRMSTYFKYVQVRSGTDIELHLAKGLGAEFRTPMINFQIARVRGRAKAFVDLGILVGAEINPKFRFTKVGGFLEGHIGAYIDYEVPMFNKYGTLTIAEFYALARIMGTWPEGEPMNIEADVLVRFKVVGMSQEIKLKYNQRIG